MDGDDCSPAGGGDRDAGAVQDGSRRVDATAVDVGVDAAAAVAPHTQIVRAVPRDGRVELSLRQAAGRGREQQAGRIDHPGGRRDPRGIHVPLASAADVVPDDERSRRARGDRRGLLAAGEAVDGEARAVQDGAARGDAPAVDVAGVRARVAPRHDVVRAVPRRGGLGLRVRGGRDGDHGAVEAGAVRGDASALHVLRRRGRPVRPGHQERAAVRRDGGLVLPGERVSHVRLGRLERAGLREALGVDGGHEVRSGPSRPCRPTRPGTRFRSTRSRGSTPQCWARASPAGVTDPDGRHQRRLQRGAHRARRLVGERRAGRHARAARPDDRIAGAVGGGLRLRVRVRRGRRRG